VCIITVSLRVKKNLLVALLVFYEEKLLYFCLIPDQPLKTIICFSVLCQTIFSKSGVSFSINLSSKESKGIKKEENLIGDVYEQLNQA